MNSAAPGHDGWEAPPESLTLGGEAVHVWRIRLAQPPARVQAFSNLLAPDERARAERYVFRRDRERFAVARGALRTILARYLRAAPARLRFSYGRYGKPFLPGEAGAGGLRFNLSHSNELAVCALARGREVGVDVEFIREDFAGPDVARRFFSAPEVAALCALPAGDARTRGFFNCWTRKEAYIKARGEGLSHPLGCFSVSLAPGEPARLLSATNDPREVTRWSLVELEVGDGYAAAVAVEGGPFSLKRWQGP